MLHGRISGVGAVLATLLLAAPAAHAAQPAVGLGTAESFGVLAGSAVTNTGPSTIDGDLGVDPGTAISGFPNGTVNGTIHSADAVAHQAQADVGIAYDDARGRTPPTAVAGDLGGRLLTAGVYQAPAAIGLTGPLVLDGQGDPAAVFIFQIGSELTTATASSVQLVNGAQPCNVFWQVGSSATLGSASTFVGTILANASVSLNNAVTVTGRVFARTGAVTLINDTITPTACATPNPVPPAGTAPGSTAPGAAPGAGSPAAGPTTTGTTNGTSLRPGSRPAGPAVGAGLSTPVLAPTSPATRTSLRRYGTSRCVPGRMPVAVTGPGLRKVVFSVDGRVVATRSRGPFRTTLRTAAGLRSISARVQFRDARAARTLRLRVRSCATTIARVTPSRTPRAPGGFTG